LEFDFDGRTAREISKHGDDSQNFEHDENDCDRGALAQKRTSELFCRFVFELRDLTDHSGESARVRKYRTKRVTGFIEHSRSRGYGANVSASRRLCRN